MLQSHLNVSEVEKRALHLPKGRLHVAYCRDLVIGKYRSGIKTEK